MISDHVISYSYMPTNNLLVISSQIRPKLTSEQFHNTFEFDSESHYNVVFTLPEGMEFIEFN